MLDNLSKPFLKNSLYTVCDEVMNLDKFRLQRHVLSPVPATFSEFITRALKITRPRRSKIDLRKLVDETSIVLKPES